MLHSTSGRLQMIYALLFLIIIACTLWVSYIGGTRSLERQVVESNLLMLEQINKRIDSLLQETDRMLIRLLQSEEVSFYYNNKRAVEPNYLLQLSKLQNQIRMMKQSHAGIRTLELYDFHNEAILSDERFDQATNAEMKRMTSLRQEKSYFKWTSSTEAGWTQMAEPAITLLRFYPMSEQGERRSGVIAAHLPESAISEMFADLPFNNSGNVQIIDEQGTILSHIEDDRIGASILSAPYSAAILAASGNGYFTDADNRKTHIFYVSSAYTGWKVIYTVNRGQISGLFLTIRNLLLVLAVCMITLALVSVTWVNRRWFLPMERFVNKIERLVDKREAGRYPPIIGSVATGSNLAQLEGRISNLVDDYSAAKRHIQESKPAWKLQLIFDIITGHRTRFALASPYLAQIGMRLYEQHFVVLLVELDHATYVEKRSDQNLYLYAVCNMAEEQLGGSEGALQGAAVQISDLQAVVLISFSEQISHKSKEEAQMFSEQLILTVRTYLKRGITVAVGSYVEAFADIEQSYREARRRMRYKLVSSRQAIITQKEMNAWDASGYMTLIEEAELLQEAVWQAKTTQIAPGVGRMLRQAQQSGFSDKDMVHFVIQLLYQTAKRTGDSAIMDRVQSEYSEIEIHLQHCPTLDKLAHYLQQLLIGMADELAEKRSAKSKRDEWIGDVTSYIDEHYQDPALSLRYLADRSGLSPNHLSKSFKQATGMNFVDYLIAVRMKAAQAILLEDTPVSHISERIGYTNHSSFLRSFKKFCGMTPSEYRTAMRGNKRQESVR